MAATITLGRHKLIYNNPRNTDRFQEGSTQTFKAGDLVKFSTGQIVIAATDDTKVLGMAKQDASTVQATYLEVDVFDLDTRLEMNLYHASGASSAATAITQLGTAYENYTSGRKTHCDIAASSNAMFVVKQISAVSYRQGEEAVGDYQGHVIVGIDASALELGGIDS